MTRRMKRILTLISIILILVAAILAALVWPEFKARWDAAAPQDAGAPAPAQAVDNSSGFPSGGFPSGGFPGSDFPGQPEEADEPVLTFDSPSESKGDQGFDWWYLGWLIYVAGALFGIYQLIVLVADKGFHKDWSWGNARHWVRGVLVASGILASLNLAYFVQKYALSREFNQAELAWFPIGTICWFWAFSRIGFWLLKSSERKAEAAQAKLLEVEKLLEGKEEERGKLADPNSRRGLRLQAEITELEERLDKMAHPENADLQDFAMDLDGDGKPEPWQIEALQILVAPWVFSLGRLSAKNRKLASGEEFPKLSWIVVFLAGVLYIWLGNPFWQILTFIVVTVVVLFVLGKIPVIGLFFKAALGGVMRVMGEVVEVEFHSKRTADMIRDMKFEKSK